MSDDSTSEESPIDASGPVVVWCTGHRCSALHRMKHGDGVFDNIASLVGRTRGAVLISTPCPGRCALASVAAVGRRDGPSGQLGPLAWFAGVEGPARFRALRSWIGDGGPQQLMRPDQVLPSALKAATCGLSNPPVLRPR